MKKRLNVFLVLAVAVSVAVGGCKAREEGPLEKMGRKVDDAIDHTADDSRNALDKAGRKVEDAGRAMQER